MDTKALFASLESMARTVDYFELRFVNRFQENVAVRQGVLEPPSRIEDQGCMVTVYAQGGSGYGATADLSHKGLKKAFEAARERALYTQNWTVWPFTADLVSREQGQFHSTVRRAWRTVPLADKVALLEGLNRKLHQGDPRFVDYVAGLQYRRLEMRLLSSLGSDIEQSFDMVTPHMVATVHNQGVTEMRSFGGYGVCRQGGFEILDEVSFANSAERIHEEALELLHAPNCPTGVMDLLLAPDQMILQIHESIGHPLEIDRILGDERNYAGTSFVTPEMFGRYQYGSDLLNVTFDPELEGEFASYAFDDAGTRAKKTYLIKDGVLVAGLGGQLSQRRSGLPGVASARSVSWNRPPIDRMANINIEPGDASFGDMVAGVERGIYMQTNCSWSIDDSRNKFQFGCEYARLIENGRLGPVVRKPNYRGISAIFWRNLIRVGDSTTGDVLGTPYCGKGEPNQAIAVGHASPTCLFSQVAVFGGEG
jgi:predicted Zn-dependent protease